MGKHAVTQTLAAAAAEAVDDEALLAWARGEGVTFHGITVAATEVGGRGCVAVRALQAGALVLRVPGRLLLTCSSARRDARLASSGLRPAALLAAHLLHEAAKGRAALFFAYVRSLPRHYNDGGCFSDEEGRALQRPHAVAAVAQLREERRADWHAARAVLLELGVPPKLCSYAAWSWAASAVCSRTVYFPEEPPGAGALCVCGDAFNHDTRLSVDGGTSCGSGCYDASSDTYDFYAQCDVEAGAQCFVSYGAHPNLTLLLHYGFILPRNTLDVALLPRSPHLEALAVDDADLFVACADGAPSWRLLAALRLHAATPALRRKHGHTAAAGEMLDWASESAAYARLRRACAGALAELPSTADEDELELSRLAAGTRMHLAVTWRLQQKRALELGVRAAEKRLQESSAAQRNLAACVLVRP